MLRLFKFLMGVVDQAGPAPRLYIEPGLFTAEHLKKYFPDGECTRQIGHPTRITKRQPDEYAAHRGVAQSQ